MDNRVGWEAFLVQLSLKLQSIDHQRQWMWTPLEAGVHRGI
jgi:hypothetical protein